MTLTLEGRQGITADMALRLARYFGRSPQLWLSLQQTWELRRAEIEVGRQITKRVDPLVPNDETIAAMKEARAGNLPRFADVSSLFNDLHADD